MRQFEFDHRRHDTYVLVDEFDRSPAELVISTGI